MLDADYLVNDPTQLVASLFLTGHRASRVLDLLSKCLEGYQKEHTLRGSDAIMGILDTTDRLRRLLSTLITVVERKEVITQITSSSIRSYSTLLTPIAQLISYLDTWQEITVYNILTGFSSSSWGFRGSYGSYGREFDVGSAYELMEKNGMAYWKVFYYLESVTSQCISKEPAITLYQWNNVKMGSNGTKNLLETEEISPTRRDQQMLDAGLALYNFVHMTMMKENDRRSMYRASGPSKPYSSEQLQGNALSRLPRSMNQEDEDSSTSGDIRQSDVVKDSRPVALINATRTHEPFASSSAMKGVEQVRKPDEERAVAFSTSPPAASPLSQQATTADHLMHSASGDTPSSDENKSKILMSLLQNGVQSADAERIYAIYLRETNASIPPSLPPRPDWDALSFTEDSASPSTYQE